MQRSFSLADYFQSPSLGNFPIFPQSRCPQDNLINCKFSSSDRAVNWVKNSPKARPGSFNISLENSIGAAMTVSNHTALYKFTFPANSTPLSPLILVDLTDLPKSRSNGAASVDPSTGRLTGNGTFNPSFGIGNYNLHFCVDFKGAEVRDTGVFTDGSVDTNSTTVSAPSDSSVSVGAFARFHAPADNTITARVGVSFISAEKACDNAEKEIPDFDFISTVTNAEEAWKAKLDVIDVNADGVSTDLQKTFWSGVYRTMISPQDYTGENPLWSSDEPYYDSYYWLVLLILIAAADSRLTL